MAQGSVGPQRIRPSRLKKAARLSCSFLAYLFANRWAMVPTFAAVAVLMIARYIAVIPGECHPHATSPAGGRNWFLCRPNGADALRDFQVIVTTPPQPIQVDPYLITREQIAAYRADLVSTDPKAAQQLRDKFLPSPAASPRPSGSEPTPELSGADRATIQGQIDAAASTLSLVEGHRTRPFLMIVREAKSRLVWTSSIGVMIIAAFAVLFGCISLTADAIRQHTKILGDERYPSVYIVFFMLVTGVACTLLGAFLLWFWGLVLDYPPPEVWQFPTSFWPLSKLVVDGNVMLDDGAMQWLRDFDPPAIDRIRIAIIIVVCSVLALTALVTATLYEGPDDDDYRNLTPDFRARMNRQHPLAAVPPVEAAAALVPYWEDLDSTETLKRRRYLGRNFMRVKYAVYLGAGLCAATIAEISARYAWPVSIVPPERGDVATAISEFGAQLSMETGIYFSLFLGALYFPAITMLRARGRDLFRARRPEATLEQQEQWLQSEGLVLKVGTNYTDILAVLAPAGLASIGQLTKLLGY